MMPMVKHGVVVYLGIVVSSLLMLAAKVYINRMLGTEALGEYEFGLSLVLLISVFAMFGLHTSTARIVARDGPSAYPLVRKAFVWVVVVCLLIILAANPLVNRLYKDKVGSNVVLHLSLLLLAVCLLNLNMAFFQGRREMGKVSAIMAVDSASRAGGVALALFLALQTRSLLLTIGLFALAFEVIVAAWIFPRLGRPTGTGSQFGDMVQISFYIFLIAASGAVSTRISAFVIAYRLDSLSLGWFAMANLFILPLSLLARTIETVLLPRASAREDFALGKVAAMASIVAVGSVVLYVLAADHLMLLFGPGNILAARALRILCIGYSAILVYSVFSAFIFGRAPGTFLGKLVMVTFVQSLLIAPALNVYLVGRVGLTGAAWATNASLLIQTTLWTIAGLILNRRRDTEGV